MTHIEVINANGRTNVEAGQLLAVVRETPAFYWVRNFFGTELKVSKKTKRIIGTDTGFYRRCNQPTVNL